MDATARQLHDILVGSAGPMTVPELADVTGADVREIDRCVWDNPDLFVWQPGHRWAASSPKGRPTPSAISPADSRTDPLLPTPPRAMRAITLASGLTLRVSRRPLDTDAFFSVSSAGNTVELTLNSSHELFEAHRMPFDEHGDSGAHLVEVLLAAWALYEDGVPGGGAMRRSLEDLRLLWGRRVIELLHERG